MALGASGGSGRGDGPGGGASSGGGGRYDGAMSDAGGRHGDDDTSEEGGYDYKAAAQQLWSGQDSDDEVLHCCRPVDRSVNFVTCRLNCKKVWSESAVSC